MNLLIVNDLYYSCFELKELQEKCNVTPFFSTNVSSTAEILEKHPINYVVFKVCKEGDEKILSYIQQKNKGVKIVLKAENGTDKIIDEILREEYNLVPGPICPDDLLN